MERELPKNWIKLKLKDAVFYKKGKKPKILNESSFTNSIPYLDIRGLEKGEIRRYADIESSRVINDNDIAIVWDGARSGWVAKGKYGAIGSTIAILTPKKIEQEFLYRFIQSKFDYINSNTRGTGIPHVDPKILWDIDFPLPPRAEQERIVGKLDALFAQHEAMKKSLEKIPVLLKNFKQQVLTQAVTGKLTEEWRGSKCHKVPSAITIGEQTNEVAEGWEWINLNKLAKLESGHTPRKSVVEYWENGNVPWICLQDIRAAHGKFIYETKFKPTKLGIENSSARLLPAGTVCFSRDISVGFTTIMGKEMATTQHFANWLCGEKLINKYLLYAFMSSSNYLIHKGKGTTVKTLYYKDLQQFMFYKPPFEEQQEIVNRVEGLFTKARAIATRCFCPPDNSLGLCVILSSNPTIFNTSFALLVRFVLCKEE